MLNMGLSEILLIAVLAIVVVGPDRLPEMMRFLGRNYGKLRRASNELRRAFQLEVDRVDAEARAAEIQGRRKALEARRKAAELARAESAVAEPRPTAALGASDEEPAPAGSAPVEPAPVEPTSEAAGEKALADAAARIAGPEGA